jgi:magnesium-transporting ATPase (P-type)
MPIAAPCRINYSHEYHNIRNLVMTHGHNPYVREAHQAEEDHVLEDPWDSDLNQECKVLILGLSFCHHLTQLSRGDIIGNPIDRTIFAASGAQLVSLAGTVNRIVDSNGKFIDVLKHFDFYHHRMTQSAFAKPADGSLVCYVKRSSKSIEKLCQSNTLPSECKIRNILKCLCLRKCLQIAVI